jgi:hypothetical protein
MDAILGLFHDAHRDDPAPAAPAQRLHRAAGDALAALSIGALWGAAAGSVSVRLATANLYKVPMVMLLSALSALPLGLYAWSAIARERDLSSFLAAQARGLFHGALVLGACAPLVALYSHTSADMGPLIAMASVAAALLLAVVTFARAVLQGAEGHAWPRRVVVVALVAAVQLAAALQLNVLAAPILSVPTAFSAGIDGIGLRHGSAP